MKRQKHPRRREKIGVFLALFSLSLFFLGADSAQGADKVADEVTGKKSVIFEGKESSDVKIRKNVSVIGTSPAKAVINGDITMEDGAVLKNVTINAKVIAVTVEKNATVTLENVTVKGASDTGIYTKQGGGTLTVRGSRITKNRKGFYILPGKNVAITGNQVTENDEEGMDIRKDIDGTISGNTFALNGEGGGEIIVGDSTLVVTKNTFLQNKASGLALQFYENNNYGHMTVSSNTFSGNNDYGLICNSPSGGDRPDNFFKNSIKLLENTFGANKKGVMKGCDLVNVVPEEEKTPEPEAVLPPPAPEIPFEEEPSRIKEVRLEKLSGAIRGIESQIQTPRNYGRKFKHYALKSDQWYFDTQRENVYRLEEQLTVAKLLPESEKLSGINILFPEKIEGIQKKLEDLTRMLDDQEHWSPFSF